LSSPYMEQFRKNKVDVLLLTDPIDEWLVQSLYSYKWNNLKSISDSDIVLSEVTEEEKEKIEKIKSDYKDFLELAKNTIWSDIIEKVELNKNLWESIWALKTATWWLTPQMEKMMKAMWQHIPPQKRILELNPSVGLVEAMKSEFDSDLKSEKLKDMIKYAYNQAILLEWWEIENIWDFIKLTNKFASKYL
jgi:molecular chaperone HtpG